jgi:hypothetical protein
MVTPAVVSVPFWKIPPSKSTSPPVAETSVTLLPRLVVHLAPFSGFNAVASAHQNRQVKSAWYNS